VECGSDFNVGSATITQLAAAADCSDFSYTATNLTGLNDLTLWRCLGVSLSESMDLSWEFEWISVLGTYTLAIEMDKGAGTPSVIINASHSATFSDPGGGPDYPFETAYSDWVTYASRRFRWRIEFGGYNAPLEWVCYDDDPPVNEPWRELFVGAVIYLEWEEV